MVLKNETKISLMFLSDYISLCDYENLLPQFLKTNYITESELPLLQEWRKDPFCLGEKNYGNI